MSVSVTSAKMLPLPLVVKGALKAAQEVPGNAKADSTEQLTLLKTALRILYNGNQSQHEEADTRSMLQLHAGLHVQSY
eukprot:14648-Heterococcus_DN1.PRE.3